MGYRLSSNRIQRERWGWLTSPREGKVVGVVLFMKELLP